MKKILITIIFILLCVMLYLAFFKGISVGTIEINSKQDIENMSINLEEKKNEAIKKTSKTYPSSIEELKTAISSLNIAKEKYNEKLRYLSNDININSRQVDRYKIEFLWTSLGNYAKEHDIEMQMDVIEAGEDTYDLEFHLVGSYIDITDFIYEIEQDAELGFRISDFKMLPDNIQTTTVTTTDQGSTTEIDNPYSTITSITEKEQESSVPDRQTNPDTTKKTYDPKRLDTTFKVYGVEINFN